MRRTRSRSERKAKEEDDIIADDFVPDADVDDGDEFGNDDGEEFGNDVESDDDDFEEEEEKPKKKKKKPTARGPKAGTKRKAAAPVRSKSILSQASSVVDVGTFTQVRDVVPSSPVAAQAPQAAEDEPPVEEQLGSIRVDCVGIRYYNGVVERNEMAIIQREPTNQYDRNAIQVCFLILSCFY